MTKSYLITARFSGQCAETGRGICKGSPALYCPAVKRIYHPESEMMRRWRDDEKASVARQLDQIDRDLAGPVNGRKAQRLQYRRANLEKKYMQL